MNRIWLLFLLGSAGAAFALGRVDAAGTAMLESDGETVKLTITLTAAMALWSGLMEILRQTGDLARLGRLLRRVLRPLFPGLTDEAAWSAMSLNMAANVLGLGNAATPAGIEATRRLSGCGKVGMRALAMLLVLNNSSLQLMPTTIIALRSAMGAAHPADIWPATLVSSGVATVAAAGLMLLYWRVQDGRRGHGGDAGGGGADRAARGVEGR